MDKIITTLGGGCFWCLEAAFQQVKGITAITSGYMGGKTLNPTYQEVCSGSTGHAEVVQLKFDSSIISFAEILEVFFIIHDPTTLNRQGADVGTQYRSVIFYHSVEQKNEALEAIETVASRLYRNKIVTEVTEASHFYPAEDYHQNFYRNNPGHGYCVAVINPKLAKLKEKRFDQGKS